jgi:hypothetical protein
MKLDFADLDANSSKETESGLWGISGGPGCTYTVPFVALTLLICWAHEKNLDLVTEFSLSFKGFF